MVIFSLIMLWAYPASEYRALTVEQEEKPTNPLKAFGEALNYTDFLREVGQWTLHPLLRILTSCFMSRQSWKGLKFLYAYLRGRPGTHNARSSTYASTYDEDGTGANLDILAAFSHTPKFDSLSNTTEKTVYRSPRQLRHGVHHSSQGCEASSYVGCCSHKSTEGNEFLQEKGINSTLHPYSSTVHGTAIGTHQLVPDIPSHASDVSDARMLLTQQEMTLQAPPSLSAKQEQLAIAPKNTLPLNESMLSSQGLDPSLSVSVSARSLRATLTSPRLHSESYGNTHADREQVSQSEQVSGVKLTPSGRRETLGSITKEMPKRTIRSGTV